MSKSGKNNIRSKKDQPLEPETTEVENPGNYLRTLRLGKGLSIQEVSETTRVSESNLKAIEDMDFASLPAYTFTRGLLNIYANFLGADAEKIVTKFMEEREVGSTQKQRSRQNYSHKILTPKRLAEPAQISSMTMAVILFLFIAASFAGYCMYTSWNPFSILMNQNRDMPSEITSVFPEEKPAPDSSVGEEIILIPPEQGSEQETEVLETKYTVTIHFLQDTGIELTMDDGETIREEFKAGDLQSWSAGASITLTFAKPDSAEILVNNAAVAFPEAQDGRYTLQIPPRDAVERQQDE